MGRLGRNAKGSRVVFKLLASGSGRRDGYVVIRGAVPPDVCARARSAILDELDVCKEVR